MLRIVPELILVPFLIRTIGESGYGVYTLAWSLMMSVEMLDMGLQSGVIKHIAAMAAQKQLLEVNKVISTAFVNSLILGMIGGTVIIATTAFLDGQVAGLAYSVVTVGIMVLFVAPLSPYIGVVLSQQRHYVNALAETISKYVILVSVVLWYKLVGPSVEALMVISASAIVSAKLAQIPIAYRLVPGLQNRLGLFNWRAFKLLTSFAVMIVLCTLCSVAHNTGVRWLMASLVSMGFVAHLAIILIPGRLLSQIVQAMTLPVMPAASKYQAVEDCQMLQELFIRGIRYCFLVVMATMIVAILLMRRLLEVWVGTEYAFLAVYAIVIFGGVAFQMSSSCAHHMLRGMGKLRVSFITSMVGHAIVPIGMILAIWLIWRKPYVAAVAGVAGGNVVFGLMQTIFCANALNVRYTELAWRAYGGALVTAIPASALALACATYTGLESLMGRMSLAILSVLLFYAGFGAFFSTPRERMQVKHAWHVMVRRTASLRQRLAAYTR